MRILKIDKRNNFLHLLPECLDDLWHLERVIEPNDIVKGESLRTLPAKEGQEKKQKIKMRLELRAEKVEFNKFGPKLRVTGPITGGSPAEFVEIKAYHTLDFGLQDDIKIEKPDGIKQFQVKRLKDAEKSSKQGKVLLVALDDERADFAFLTEQGIDEFLTVRAAGHGKQYKQEDGKNSYLNEIYLKLNDLAFQVAIIAGPGFTKKDLKKFLAEKRFGKKIFFEDISVTGVSGLNEIVNRGLIEKVAENALLVEETKLVESLLKLIMQQNPKVIYGEKAIVQAIGFQQVEELFVTDKKLFTNRGAVEELMKKVEAGKGKVHLISAEHDAGKKLQGFGGLVAVKWY